MASTRIARMTCIWVILSAWICCIRCSQRRLIPIDGDEQDSNLDLNLDLDLDRCDNDDEQCQSMATAADRSLLSGGALLVYVGAPQLEELVPIELDPSGTVGDLRVEAARALRVEPHEVELSYQGVVMRRDQNDETLADMGFSQECTVQAHVNIRNDIDDLERFLGVEFPTEIHEMKHAALQRVTDKESVNFSGVIKAINDIVDEHKLYQLNWERQLPRINFVTIADPNLHRLQWQHLPPSTQQVSLLQVGATEMSLQGIECANLQKLKFWSLPNLSRLNLDGIQKCTSLTELHITRNRALRDLDLTPLSGSASLQDVDLSNNALTAALDLSPLSECPALQEVDISGNAFSDTRRAELKQALAARGVRHVEI